jgi:cobalt/nickel transport system ATP-binding protein
MQNKAVQIKNLSFTYPNGIEVLKNVSLDIDQGESVALTGPNGSGKTTMLLHLNGIFLDESADSSVHIMGRKIEKQNLRDIRREVGIVFQDPDDQLFMPTVFDDIAFGPSNLGYKKDEIKRSVEESLRCVGMEGFENRVSHHLSIGQKKRISIATVLAMNPAVMVLDEPSASLDPKGIWQLVETIRGLSMTKIIVTHDLTLIKALCDRIIILDEGRIVADGKTADITADESLMKQYYFSI